MPQVIFKTIFIKVLIWPIEIYEILKEAGFNNEQINLIHGPIGIKLGGRSAPEIALSIIAQLVSETYKKW